jgi:hypothetical protein
LAARLVGAAQQLYPAIWMMFSRPAVGCNSDGQKVTCDAGGGAGYNVSTYADAGVCREFVSESHVAGDDACAISRYNVSVRVRCVPGDYTPIAFDADGLLVESQFLHDPHDPDSQDICDPTRPLVLQQTVALGVCFPYVGGGSQQVVCDARAATYGSVIYPSPGCTGGGNPFLLPLGCFQFGSHDGWLPTCAASKETPPPPALSPGAISAIVLAGAGVAVGALAFGTRYWSQHKRAKNAATSESTAPLLVDACPSQPYTALHL